METKAIIEINPKFITEEDELGVEYDITNQRLITAHSLDINKNTTHYKVRPGTKIICDSAFMNIDNIKFIELPNSIKIIERRAFIDCKSLEIINFPNGIIRIEDSAFCRCKKLNSIKLPASIEALDSTIFHECTEIKSFEIDRSNKNFIVDSGITYSINKKKIIFAIPNLIHTNITLKKEVNEIKQGAFYNCRSLISIRLSYNIEKINDNAFDNCINLQKINLPRNLKSIGEHCFMNTSIKFITIPKKVEFIGTMAFSACHTLTKINVSKLNQNFTSVDGVLISTEALSLINHPAGSKKNIYSVPKSVRRIERGAFHSCLNLSHVEIPKGITEIDDNTFSFCRKLLSISIPNGITRIGNRAFYSCGTLKEIKLPKTVDSIEVEAFGLCSSMSRINIPKNLTNIEFRAFSMCNALKITTNKDNQRFKSFKGVLYEKTVDLYNRDNHWSETNTPF